jgi:hypothetical protein
VKKALFYPESIRKTSLVLPCTRDARKYFPTGCRDREKPKFFNAILSNCFLLCRWFEPSHRISDKKGPLVGAFFLNWSW